MRPRSAADERQLLGTADGGAAIVDAELVVDRLGVGTHRVERHPELARDLGAVEVGAQQAKDVELALAQRLDEAGGFGAGAASKWDSRTRA